MNRVVTHTRALLLLLLLSACAEPSDEPCIDDDGSCVDDVQASTALALLPPPPRFYANVNIESANGSDGTVTASSSSAGARCVAEGCTVRVGSRVTVVATPTTGRGFSHWTGCSTSTNPSLTITALRTTTCSAQFTTTRLYVRGESSPVLGGTVSASSSSAGASCSAGECLLWAGSSARLSVSAGSGYKFDGWQRCSPASSTTLSFSNVQTSSRCIAVFSPLNPYTLSVSSVGPDGAAGAGQVYMSSRAGRCDSTSCVVTPGAEVTLQAGANSGYAFDRWSGCASGSQQPLTVSVNAANTQCAAHFRAL